MNMLKNSIQPVNDTIKNEVEHKLLYTSNIDYKICKEQHEIIILVTHTNSVAVRNVIRRTWGESGEVLTTDGSINLNWKVIFVVTDKKKKLGELKREFMSSNDMVAVQRANYVHIEQDSLNIMTGLEFASKHCRFKYLLTIKDDMMVNTPALFSYIHDAKTPRTELYGGLIRHDSPVLPKNGERSSAYIAMTYPRYAHGGAFLMSSDVVSKIIPFF